MKTTVKNVATIDQEINRIYQLLKTQVSEGTTVKQEKARRGSSCSGMICIRSRDDADRQDDGMSDKTAPMIRYAFYPSVYSPSLLGSVAIYAKDATALCSRLKTQRTFFGIDIIDATVEYGKRPFVDVRLRA